MASDAPLTGRLREATEAMMRAEASLRATESRYHTLFESIDEGFCVIEVLFENDRPVDYRFLEANPAFLEQTGLTEAIGRTMRELAPEHESHWFDIYGRVAKTGEPIRFEAPAAALNRYFDVYAFRVDDPEKNHVAILFNDISKRKRADETLHDEQIRALKDVERRVTERTVERDDLRRRLDLAEEEERRRLSRELHDEAGQHLTALALGLQALSDIAPPESEIDRRAGQLIALAETLSRELHAVAVRLRPRALDDFGLEAAISAYAEEWSKQNGIAVDVHAGAHKERLPDLVESGLYRIVQEALTNVAKHSGATRASVVVERRNGHVSAIVEDNGRGIEAVAEGNTESAFGLGLLGMRERASLLGGSIDLESSPGHGTSVFVRLPIVKTYLRGGEESDD